MSKGDLDVRNGYDDDNIDQNTAKYCIHRENGRLQLDSECKRRSPRKAKDWQCIDNENNIWLTLAKMMLPQPKGGW